MSRPRIIPVLLMDKDKRLVKTRGFGERTYIGDPFNTVRLFNEKEVDEIFILDIDATQYGREPDFGFIAELASECFMPLAYGGGLISTFACEQVCRAGVEKIVLGTRVDDIDLIKSSSISLGSQSIVGCFDYRGSGINAKISNAQKRPSNLESSIDAAVDAGVGEVVIQSIDRDGERSSYDLETLKFLRNKYRVPLIPLGGAKDYSSFVPAFTAGASAVASGSVFCFVGRLRAVLVNYPDRLQMENFESELSQLRNDYA